MNQVKNLIILFIFALVQTVQGQCCAINTNTTDTCSNTFEYYPQGFGYQGEAWSRNTSKPYRTKRGLDGRHLSVWASHGRYFDNNKKSWRWQRPYLFCTTEDLLSQSFVYPYLIPMLERAGAVVFTPRERDTQEQEAIVDNDTRDLYGSYYEKGEWETVEGRGFGLDFQTLNDTVFPFQTGTSRMTQGGTDARVIWQPQIPETGDYAVYVSYSTLPGSTSAAHYVVHHSGQSTHFSVNQQMGEKTWVYLGTFRFEAGQNERNIVELIAADAPRNTIVTADAVRFGGGRGLAERSNPSVSYTYSQRVIQTFDTIVTDSIVRADMLAKGVLPDSIPEYRIELRETMVTDTLAHYLYDKGTTSGLPRHLEGARYYAQWAGLPDTLVSREHGLGDYNDDLRSRSYLLNVLAGGSTYVPDTLGRHVPIEMQFALHTDAGFHRNGSIYGSLSIATPYDDYGKKAYRSGLDRKASERYATNMLSHVAQDLSRTFNVNWPQREVRIKNYSETRSPQVPSVILELLSHQNFRDMVYAHDPNFKFTAARAIYKTILREIYSSHQAGDPIIQPLPVEGMGVHLRGGKALIRWTAVRDSLEPTAWPDNFVLYTRKGQDDWDNGVLTNGRTSMEIPIQSGVHYQFKVTALNDGGESFPSEPVSIYLAEHGNREKIPTILVVNGFDRLSGPARIEDCNRLGFDLDADVGVSYFDNISISGAQQNFSVQQMGTEGTRALGYCGAEYTGMKLAGNRFDGIELHTNDIVASFPNVNVVSLTRAAFDELSSNDLQAFSLIDYIGGLQADMPHNLKNYKVFTEKTKALLRAYSQKGGPLLVSGAHLGCPGAHSDSLQQVIDGQFLAETLHASYQAEVDHNHSGTFFGMGIDIPVYNRPGETHYPCQRSDILEPVGDTAFAAFAYSPNGFAAGVAWTSPGRGITIGFPIDCISDMKVRQAVMKAAIQFLM